MANKKINQLDVRTSPTLADLLAIADPSTGYAYKITGTSLATTLGIDGKVPYTGATASVNLGVYGLTTDYYQLSTSPTATNAVGRTIWNDTIGSTQTMLKGGSVVLKNGVDLVARIVNKVTPAATLTKAAYKAVRVSGAQGQRLAIAYAQANNDNNSADTIGLVCETIATNQEGFIITVGQLNGINTTGSLQSETWADGDVLYLSPTTAGNLTNIKPTGATGHIVVIGYVEYAHAINGSIYVKIMNGWELDELHNVYISSVANNDVLVYESASSLWKNKSIATILGYTPQAQLNGTGFVKATGTTISYDNSTYALDSAVMHLAGSETATGYKTFSIGLQTNTGNNLLNVTSGNTAIGYSSDPLSSATYKLDVNGSQKIGGGLFIFGGTYTSSVGMIWKDAAYGLAITGNGTNYSTSLFSSSGLYVFRIPQGGQLIEFVGSQRNLGSIQQNSGNNFFNFSDSNTYIGYTSVPPATYKLDVNGNTRIVSNLNLALYTSSSAVTGTLAGLLGFDSSGNVITSAAGISGSGTSGQVTYWNGTSSVTGSSTLTYTPTTSLLVNNSVTAASAIARGVNFTPTLTAAANNDVLVGLDIIPAFTNGAFTGVTNWGLRLQNSNVLLNSNYGVFFGASSVSIKGDSGIGSISLFTNSIERFKIDNSGSITAAGTAKFSSVLITGSNINLQNGLWYFNIENDGYGIQIKNVTNSNTVPLRIFKNDNIAIGSTTDAGYRLDVNGTGASTGALRVTGGNVQFGSATGLNWDNTNGRLGIGTSSSLSYPLTIYNNTNAFINFITTSGVNKFGGFRFQVDSYDRYTLAYRGLDGNLVYSRFNSTGTYQGDNLTFINATGNIIITASGTASDSGYRLDINGTGASTGALRVTGGLSLFQGGKMTIAAATTSYASLNIPSGTAPTTPNDGDIWFDGTDLKIRVAGSTKTFTIV